MRLPTLLAGLLFAAFGAACSPDTPLATEPPHAPEPAEAVAVKVPVAASGLAAMRIALDDVVDRLLPGLESVHGHASVRAALARLSARVEADDAAGAGQAAAAALAALDRIRAHGAGTEANAPDLDAVRLVLETVGAALPGAGEVRPEELR